MQITAQRSASHRMATRTWNRCGVAAAPKVPTVSWWLDAKHFYERAQEQDVLRRSRQEAANYMRRDVA